MTTEIRQMLKDGHLVIGTRMTMKLLRQNNVKKVYLASNAPAALREDVDHYSKIAGVAVTHVKMNNEELGTLCKKPFSISLIGVHLG